MDIHSSFVLEEASQLCDRVIIMDHAKTGYLDMPARGGRSDLSDETIELAVEYMLELTFADLPAD